MFAASKTASVSGGYQISRSLRFNSADSAYLNRTPATTTNRTTWTWSGWVKRASFGSSQVLFGAGPDGSNYTIFYFSGTVSENLEIFNYTGATTTGYAYTNSVFRDPSAWYHVVLAVDTTQGTSADRTKIYVNNVLQPITISTTFGSSVNTWVNTNNNHRLGSTPTTSALYGGYMTEVNFIDGQALTPSSFGETNAQTGVWQPKAYSGSYGTNGFYLNFSDNSNTTAATLGKDYSGNGNNWTPNGFLVSAGANNDSLVDSPTSYGTDTGVGGTVRGNYATLNALSTGITLSNGNLSATNGATGNKSSYSTIGVSSGKWYAEAVWTATGSTGIIGVALQGYAITDGFAGNGLYSYGYEYSGTKYNNGSGTSYGATWTNGDAIGVALDLDAGTITFYKNGTSQGTAFTSLPSGTYFIGVSLNSSTTDTNFGQRPFAYTAPSGFKALCTQNLPTPTIGATTATQAGKYFNPVLYTGNGTTQTISGVGFQPDLVWCKGRNNAYWHSWIDAVRGRGFASFSNVTNAEFTSSVGKELTAFTSDGFSLGPDDNFSINSSGAPFVAWNWKANGAGSSNTAGSITSTVSANTTSGFSVVTYTGTGANATVGHGLGVAPSMVIVKRRDTTANWEVRHISIAVANTIRLNLTDAETSATTVWNSTAPSSTLFSIGTSTSVNASSGTYVAYCFAPIAGYSAFGQYTGNGSSDGAFVYTGFRPAYVLIKRTTSAYDWWILDVARGTINAVKGRLYANATDAESTTYPYVDFLSNGFKLRDADGGLNANGEPYIYACFAQNPFKYSLAR